MPTLPATPSGFPAKTRTLKYAIWSWMACATLSVLFYSEIPLLRQAQEQTRLHALGWILIPHAIAGTIALLTGPTQFSTRLRRQHAALHRGLGRLYVGAVLLAAPLAVLSTLFSRYPRAYYFQIAIAVQAGAWIVTTTAGLIAAIGRRLPAHRDWMTRSYAVTFTFVATRVLQPIPAWNRLGRFWFAVSIVLFTLCAVLLPQLMRLAQGRGRAQHAGTQANGSRYRPAK